MIQTNLKEPLQKDTETQANVSLNCYVQRKTLHCKFWNHLILQRTQITKALQKTWKKVKHKAPQRPPSLLRYPSLTPGSRTHWDGTGTDGVDAGCGWQQLTYTGCKWECLEVILANYCFSLLNFSYTFSHQILTTPLEPMSFPMYFQLNHLCPGRGSASQLLT